MKNAVLAGATVVAALILPGCPIYPDEQAGCYDDRDCMPGYQCDAYSGVCYEPGSPSTGGFGATTSSYCTAPADCGINETCTAAAVCRVGDCSNPGYGCIQGYTCTIVNGVHTCALDPLGTAGQSGGGAGGTGGVIVVGGAGESAGGESAGGESAGGESAGGESAGGESAGGAPAGGSAGQLAAGGAAPAGAAGAMGTAGNPTTAGGAAGMSSSAGAPGMAGSSAGGAAGSTP